MSYDIEEEEMKQAVRDAKRFGLSILVFGLIYYIMSINQYKAFETALISSSVFVMILYYFMRNERTYTKKNFDEYEIHNPSFKSKLYYSIHTSKNVVKDSKYLFIPPIIVSLIISTIYSSSFFDIIQSFLLIFILMINLSYLAYKLSSEDTLKLLNKFALIGICLFITYILLTFFITNTYDFLIETVLMVVTINITIIVFQFYEIFFEYEGLYVDDKGIWNIFKINTQRIELEDIEKIEKSKGCIKIKNKDGTENIIPKSKYFEENLKNTIVYKSISS